MFDRAYTANVSGSNQTARATGFAFVLDGEVRVSLPKGHYTLYADALRFTSDTTAEERVVTQPQLQVTGQKNQVVGIDFRTATAQPSLTVPRPTAAKDYTIAYYREWQDAGFVGFTGGDASTVFRIAQAPAPTSPTS